MKLVIFDLDQTLVEFIVVHDKAANELFKTFFKIDARLTEIDYAGKSLVESFRNLATFKNIPEEKFQEHREELLKQYEAAFARNLPPDAGKYILPGVEKLLSGLAGTKHIIMLYTGDSKGIVEAVFNTTGLGKYFSACFYGTSVNKRADMVSMALDKAKEMTGATYSGKDIVIIGDSMRDIEVARQFDATMIAVATGIYSVDELVRAGADKVFKDLSDYKEVIRVIDNPVAK